MTDESPATSGVLRVEDHVSMRAELAGWPVQITSYRLGSVFRCTVANLDPGATVARAEGATREEAERVASEKAAARLRRTRTY